jgi:hypothetical protein
MGEHHARIVPVRVQDLGRDGGRDRRAAGVPQNAVRDIVAVEVDRPRLSFGQEDARPIAFEQCALGRRRLRTGRRVGGIPRGEAGLLGEVAGVVGAGGERQRGDQDRGGAGAHQPRPR